MKKNAGKKIQQFCKDVSLKRFQAHCQNDKLILTEQTEDLTLSGNVWKCGILWGNDDIHGLLIVNFTTINILAIASSMFENTKDSVLFEHTKDFMKEYCNLYAGLLKGTFDNAHIKTHISLPIIAKSLDTLACFGGLRDNTLTEKWILKNGSSFIEVESSIHFSEGFDLKQLDFLSESKTDKSPSEGDVDFF